MTLAVALFNTPGYFAFNGAGSIASPLIPQIANAIDGQFQFYGSGSYIAAAQGDGSKGNPWLISASTASATTAFAIFGTGGFWGAVQGDGSYDNPYQMAYTTGSATASVQFWGAGPFIGVNGAGTFSNPWIPVLKSVPAGGFPIYGSGAYWAKASGAGSKASPYLLVAAVETVTADFILLEDSSGFIELESGAGVIQLET